MIRRGRKKEELLRVSDTRIGKACYDTINSCLRRGWISQGRYVAQLEDEFADLCGTRHAIACSSGTAALHLALLALGVGQGDTVIVPALTYIATANAATYCGARVAFAEIEKNSWCADLADVQLISRNFSGGAMGRQCVTIPVHLYDSIAPADAIVGPCIEDAAHAPGAINRDGRRVGSLGTLGCFSFYASKILGCGEGGMVTTDSDELAEAAILYRGQGATQPGVYYHSVVGYNYRMTDLQAAVILGQMAGLRSDLDHRRNIIIQYENQLQGYGLVAPERVQLQSGVPSSGWVFAVLLPRNIDRDRVISRLRHEANVETRPFFIPLTDLPPYRGSRTPPIAADVARRGLCLPVHCNMDNDDVQYVVSHLARMIYDGESKYQTDTQDDQ